MTSQEWELVVRREWGEYAVGGITVMSCGRGAGYGRVQAYSVSARCEQGRYRSLHIMHTSKGRAIRMALAALRAEDKESESESDSDTSQMTLERRGQRDG